MPIDKDGMLYTGDGTSSPNLHVIVSSISDVTTEARCLIDGIYFVGVHILRCYEGRFRFSFKDRPDIILNPGETLVVYPRHVVTLNALEEKNRLVYGVFDGTDVESYFDEVGFFDCAKGATDAHYESIMELSRRLEKTHAWKDAHWRKCHALLTDILRTQAIEMRRNGDALIFDAVRMVHTNLRKCIASVKELSNGLGISRVQLRRIFMNAGLGSPSDFIRGKQLHTVRDLLENTDLPLSEIAARTGFLSPAHFTTFVKRMTRLTPTQLRQGSVKSEIKMRVMVPCGCGSSM